MSQIYTETIEKYIAEVSATLQELPLETIGRVAETIEKARISEKTVFIFGNGGSASTATHMACDLSKGSIAEGKPRMRVISLCENIALIAAWANDTAYEHIFAEQLRNLAKPGDVVIGISGSGNSLNIINGINLAKEMGATTIGFSGFDGGKLKDIVDLPIVVTNHCMEQVEDVHLLLEHVITICLRNC